MGLEPVKDIVRPEILPGGQNQGNMIFLGLRAMIVVTSRTTRQIGTIDAAQVLVKPVMAKGTDSSGKTREAIEIMGVGMRGTNATIAAIGIVILTVIVPVTVTGETMDIEEILSKVGMMAIGATTEEKGLVATTRGTEIADVIKIAKRESD